MPEIGYLAAALAGLLSFLSPCILPMLPFYLCYLGGMSMAELRGGGQPTPAASRRLIAAAMAFALGVTTIFVALGLGATAIGQVFADYHRPLRYVAAAILIGFGLHALGLIRLPALNRQARLDGRGQPDEIAASSLPGAYVVGLAFGFGWTPCVGPALAAILLVASGSGELWRGASLLLVYGLAMTLPFVIAAAFARPVLDWLSRHRAAFRHSQRIMGAGLILFGILIATGGLARIGDWMIRSFDWSATVI